MQDSTRAEQFFASKVDFPMGPVELEHMVDKGSANVIDVRVRADYEKAHIPGAENLPKGKWDSFRGLVRDKLNVIYCYSHANAAHKFAAKNYPVLELEGGFEGWTEHRFETETETFKRGT